MSVDLDKIKEELPGIAEALAIMLRDDGIPMIQETAMTLEEVEEMTVSINMKTKDGDPIRFFLGVTTKLNSNQDDDDNLIEED